MDKIINGKKYDTQTAILIADYSHGYGGDFNREDSALYVSPKGQFFVAGKGGAMSRWSQSIGQNTQSGGEGLYLVAADEARTLAERWDYDPDLYEKYFGVEAG